MIKLLILLIFLWLLFPNPAAATADPLSQENNKVGIGLLSPDSEIEEAAEMVNGNGQWGWVILVIKKSERDVDRWQKVFHKMSEKKLIPIVRIATEFDTRGYWQKPTEEDANSWADFLSKLYWPVSNKYVQVYNEVNHANEWGGIVDPASYAIELDKFISSIKSKDQNFFILNSPLDLAVGTSGQSLDAQAFYDQMEKAVPGIFTKIDGWASHSYPNPDFSASPYKTGRLSIKGYEWEMEKVSKYLKGKNLPIFITETGWKRATPYNSGLDEDSIKEYYKVAFEKIWNDSRIAAITPFIFNFTTPPFSVFSFKAGDLEGRKYFDHYFTLKSLPKKEGKPHMEDKIHILETRIPQNLINKIEDEGFIKFRNEGNFLWQKNGQFSVSISAPNVEIANLKWSTDNFYPGQSGDIKFTLKSNKSGKTPLTISVKNSDNLLFATEMELKSDPMWMKLVEALRALKKS